MIQCPKCKAHNPSTAETCSQCQSSLLPPPNFIERFKTPGTMLGIGLLCAAAVAWIYTRPDQTFFMVYCIGVPLVFVAVMMTTSSIMGFFQKPRPYEAYLNRAHRHVQIDPDQALADLTHAFELTPTGMERRLVLRSRAELFDRYGRTEEARKDWQQLLGIIDLEMKSARGYLKDALKKERKQCLQKLDLDPNTPPTTSSPDFSEDSLEQDRNAAAEASLDVPVDQLNTAIDFTRAGFWKLVKGEVDKAARIALEGTKKHPRDAKLVILYAACQATQGQEPQAEQTLESVRQWPSNFFTLIAEFHNNGGDAQTALRLYDFLLRKAPTLSTAWYNRGLLLEKLGRKNEAMESYHKISIGRVIFQQAGLWLVVFVISLAGLIIFQTSEGLKSDQVSNLILLGGIMISIYGIVKNARILIRIIGKKIKFKLDD